MQHKYCSGGRKHQQNLLERQNFQLVFYTLLTFEMGHEEVI